MISSFHAKQVLMSTLISRMTRIHFDDFQPLGKPFYTLTLMPVQLLREPLLG
jgi:hypothetical protein